MVSLSMPTDKQLLKPSAQKFPVSDLSSVKGYSDVVRQSSSLAVYQGEEDNKDSIVQIRCSALVRIRRKLNCLLTDYRPIGQIILVAAGIFFGAGIDAWLSPVAMDTNSSREWIRYGVLPVLGLISVVVFFLKFRQDQNNISDIVNEVLLDLPDPERLVAVKRENDK